MNEQTSRLYHKIAFDEKRNYLQFIVRLGENGLKKLFTLPGKKISLWWFSLVAEKQPIKSSAYEDLIALITAAERQEPAPARCPAIAERFLASPFVHVVRGIRAYFDVVWRSLMLRFSVRNLKKRKERLDKDRYIVVSYFPHVNKDKAQQGLFENKYIPSFHNALEENQKDSYSHVCIPVDYDGYDYQGAVRLLKSFSKNQSIFFIHEFLTPRHALLCILYYCYFLVLFILNAHWIRKVFRYTYNGREHDVWNIFRRDTYESCLGRTMVTSLFYILLFEEMVSHLGSDPKVITICEMQWWEKALYAAAGKRNIVTVGYQHSILPELLLNYFDTPEDPERKDYALHHPLPDYIATVGKIPAELLIKYQWPKERIVVWGAQRFETFRDLDALFVPWENKKNTIVCAFSISVREAKRVLTLLKLAYSDNPGYRILLKAHPNLDLMQLISKRGLHLRQDVFEITNESLTGLMRHAKAMIVTESSSSFYAMAAGSHVIVPRFFGGLDCSPLSYISDLPLYVYTAEELRATCDRVMQSAPIDLPYAEARALLKDYLYFPHTDRNYLEAVNDLH